LKTGKNCFIHRFDTDKIIEVPANKTIKLNGYYDNGYVVIEDENKKNCDGKVVVIDGTEYVLQLKK
jgi:hypothetical protein